jgi:AraC-like DNA-binding protein
MLHRAKRLQVSTGTRFLEFPWGSKIGWPLREIGVDATGYDYFHGNFLSGTIASPFHLLFFVIAGEVECDSGSGFHTLPSGHWALCPAHAPHWIRLRKGRAEAFWLYLLDLPRWSFLRAHGPESFPIQNPEMLKISMLEAVREAASPEYGSFEIATSHVNILRLQLIREIDRACRREADPMLIRFAELWRKVNSRLEENWTVERLASEVHLSPSSLYLHAARHHGVKAMEMVTRLRIERVKDLLLHTDDTIETIAAAVGYQTPYALSAAFLRETGQRPGQYRKANWTAK